MNVIDFILNLAGILLWFDWCSGLIASKAPVPALSLANSLKRAGAAPFRPWVSFIGLVALLLLRGFAYHSIGYSMGWAGMIDLGAIALPFRSDFLSRALLFSFGSFALALGAVYSWLLLLSCVNRALPNGQPIHRFVRAHLLWLEKVPCWLKLLLPLVLCLLVWATIAPMLASLELLPRARTQVEPWEQGLVLGLGSYLVWRWLLVAVFALHFLNTYVYFGEHPFWEYISHTARTLLAPVGFLRFSRFDLAPVAGIAAVVALADFAVKPLTRALFERIPL